MALGIIRGGLLAASGLLAFTTVTFAAAPALQRTPADTHRVSHKNSNRSLDVLYDQTSNPSGFGTLSQNLGAEFNSAAADDFTVPDGTHWDVQEVDISGMYFNGSGPAKTVQVTIYKNKGHKPGTVRYDLALKPAVDAFGSFTINVGHMKLKPGHYWISAVANVDFALGSEWAWENQTAGTTEGDLAVYQNPDGTTCKTWTTQKKCFGGDALGDQVFALKGKSTITHPHGARFSLIGKSVRIGIALFIWERFMKSFVRAGILAGVSALVVAAPSFAAGRHAVIQNTHAGAHGTTNKGTDHQMSVLWDQTKKDSGFGIVSQNFGDEFDSAAADDFTVDDIAVWTIKEVDVVGAYSSGGGPAPSENVIVWKAKKNSGLGGAKVVAEFDNVAGVDDGGNLAITLPGNGLKLKGGHYWISVVVNMPFDPNGQWFWENQTTQVGDPAMWENPGDGYGSGCTTWTDETQCVQTPEGDQMFALKGKVKLKL